MPIRTLEEALVELASKQAALDTIVAQRDDMLRIVKAADDYVRRGPRADGAWTALFDAVVESRFSPFRDEPTNQSMPTQEESVKP
jgi:hypothetical protein